MSAMSDLATGVREALGRKVACKVVVHNAVQAELGKQAAERMAPEVGGDPGLITFEVVAERERDLYPVGAIST